MLSDINRKKLLEHLKRMGIDPAYVARDGANSEGYRTFVFEPGKWQEDGSRLSRFVPWTESQLNTINMNRLEFQEWFDEGA